ncbi:HAMP domain-containing histidine kinase [Amphibacillus sp. MSJ-3]|nr:HAMP domain-containing histidine kinase [Amphibacillus sp. MSJ-3]
MKKFSHSIFVKIVVFLLMIASVAGLIYTSLNIFKITNGNIEILFENSFIESSSFKIEFDYTINQLTDLIDIYKSEENILEGNTIDNDELEMYSYNDDAVDSETSLTDEVAEVLVDSETDATSEIIQERIADELKDFKRILKNLELEDEPIYYVTDGKNTFSNTKQTKKEQFENYPVYYISEDYDWEIYPSTLHPNHSLYGYPEIYRSANPEDTKIFVGYTEDYIDTLSKEWNVNKTASMKEFYVLLVCAAIFILSFIYLIVTTGRDSFQDKSVHMHPFDKLYVDFNLIIILFLTGIWLISIDHMLFYLGITNWTIYAITLPVMAILMILLLSLTRHLKNKTFFKHSLFYTIVHGLYLFVKDIYDSGSVGIKVVIIVILYPIITTASLFFFPITIGLAVWFALKQVKKFKQIQEGTQLMKEGNLQHQINLEGKGEFAKLASNINRINEGFKQAVHNELKNERMKTELITNVSHDIRTPLTSLITYTDLLKTETDPEKIQEYIGILDQKSKRLKGLTDDLFAAAKASSGDIPVNLQQIDLVALINQGIGEVSEQITAKKLIFKVNEPTEKVYVTADGKLLWRSIENILSNIFNYALEGSRVYIDITNQGDWTLISFKNISKYELNVTEEELMERFKRGDDSRTSQGSGLGLSITKSLIENQNGKFKIKIDGDLFKSMIYLPSVDHVDSHENE